MRFAFYGRVSIEDNQDPEASRAWQLRRARAIIESKGGEIVVERHREGVAWAKSAVRAILTNPRYTGHQVWNKQRKDEILIDVEDIAQGHITKLRWNDHDQWIFSEKIVHAPIVDHETFLQVSQKLAARRCQTGGTKARERTKRTYALRGLLYCGLCNRKMQAHSYSDYIYFRCRYPDEYGLANKVQHPRNIYVRENEVIAILDDWLCKVLAPHRIKQALADSGGTDEDSAADTAVLRAQAKIAECGTKLSRHRAALETGADPATVVRWIAETNAELALAETQIRTSGTKPRRTMTPEAIEELIAALGGLVEILHDADSADRQEVYRQLGLRLTYDPEKQVIRVEVNLHPDQLSAVHDRYHGVTVRVRGGT